MPTVIRKARHRDKDALATLHAASITVLCGGAYTREQVAAWTGVLVPAVYDTALRDKVFLVAEGPHQALLGLGMLDADHGEISAIYIHPDAAGQGVGSALLQALEKSARGFAIPETTVFSTLNAKGFYLRHGYEVQGETFHRLPDGSRLECIRMNKRLTPAAVRGASLSDFEAWIALAREVEPLFGPMADEVSFRDALKQAITAGSAFCIGPNGNDREQALSGGVVLSPQTNEIAWLAVSAATRGKGYGRALLELAVGRLNNREPMGVQTFDASVPEGRAARKLYEGFGFSDLRKEGMNPAGLPTVIMERPASLG